MSATFPAWITVERTAMEAMIRSGRRRKVWRVAREARVVRGYAITTGGPVTSKESERPMSTGGGAHIALLTEDPVMVEVEEGAWVRV